MKSEIRGYTVAVKSNYPCLKIAKDSGRIVLFTEPRTGMQVNTAEKGTYKMGRYCVDWWERDFELLPDNCEVVLSNK